MKRKESPVIEDTQAVSTIEGGTGMRHLGLRTRILLITSVFLLITNIALGTALTRQSQKAMKTQIDERMLDVVKTAAAMLDGDVLEQLSAEDKDTPEYQAVVDTLNRFRDNINLAYIYCLRDMGDKSFTFTIDSDAVDPAEFGAPVAYTEALYNASRGIPSVDDEPYEIGRAAFTAPTARSIPAMAGWAAWWRLILKRHGMSVTSTRTPSPPSSPA